MSEIINRPGLLLIPQLDNYLVISPDELDEMDDADQGDDEVGDHDSTAVEALTNDVPDGSDGQPTGDAA